MLRVLAAALVAGSLVGLTPAVGAAQAKRVIPPQMQGLYDGFHYAPAVQAGDFLYLSGVVGVPGGEGPAGLEAAARQAFSAAALVLAEAGYTFADVVEMTSFHTDLEAQKEPFQKVRDEFLAEPWPAWTALDVDRLWMPEAVVEIRFVAWREGAGAADAGGEAEPGTHAGPFAAVERRLAEGPWELPFHITASGAVDVDVRGRVGVGPGGAAHLEVEGDFAGRPLDHALRSDGREVVVTTPDGEERMPAPPHLADALSVGLVRMGVLHNIARLAGGRLPDHAEGGVRGWVRLYPVGGEDSAGDSGGDGGGDGGAMRVAIRVSNVPSGTAELVLGADGMPSLRVQEVAFPTGTMRVQERYGAAAATVGGG